MTSCSLGSLCWSYSGVLLVPVCCRVIAVCCRVIAFCSGEEVQILDFQNFNIDYPHHLTAEQQSSWFQMPVDNSCVTTDTAQLALTVRWLLGQDAPFCRAWRHLHLCPHQCLSPLLRLRGVQMGMMAVGWTTRIRAQVSSLSRRTTRSAQWPAN